MGNPLVIVESPAKARTIARFLGGAFDVEASVGHIRDLPESAASIPSSIRKKPWARVGVNVDEDFEPVYVYTTRGHSQIKKLKPLVKKAEAIFLATDEDREGEAIAWHLMEVLKKEIKEIPVYRLVFHEITKSAIEQALKTPRSLNLDVVQAQETRRIVDRLFGYSVSPVLWKKIRPRLSAGRVQSVAVRLVVERERARMRFVSATWYDLRAQFGTDKGPYDGRLVSLDGRRLAAGRDFSAETGALTTESKREQPLVLTEETARGLEERLAAGHASVKTVTTKSFTERPAAPFITSTLQQEANRKLRWSARRTMNTAQRLYEAGWITYMRTDSTQIAGSALETLRGEIERTWGKDLLPAKPRIYRTSSKGAQEAHEAIRPAGERMRTMAECRQEFGADEAALYELIRNRSLACQMKDARGVRVTADTLIETLIEPQGKAEQAIFRSGGKTYTFKGFREVYVESRDSGATNGNGNGNGNGSGSEPTSDRKVVLPPLVEGAAVEQLGLSSDRHETQPPPRLNDATLVKELETRGIGRPSTYATIIETIESRGYVRKRGTALVPSWVAFAVTKLLETHFGALVDYDFTARLEDGLDEIAEGQGDRSAYLEAFYRGPKDGDGGLLKLIAAAEETADPREVCRVEIGSKDDKTLVVRVGRYGPYIDLDGERASVPEDLAPDEVDVDKAIALLEEAARWPRYLGDHPENGKAINVHLGRFGPHVQEGTTEEAEGDKPKRASLLKGMDPETVDLETALKLLALPRSVGNDTAGNDILVANGRYGPYVKAGSENRSLPADMSPLEITRDQALLLLSKPKPNARGVLFDLGKVKGEGKDDKETSILVKRGRYGVYVTDGDVNATVAKGTDPGEITLEQAIAWIEAKRQQAAEGNQETGGGRRG